jgi:prephenate dehydratase
MTTVAFQGVEGAYSQEAMYRFFASEVKTMPCLTFEDIFLAMEEGQADYGILPVENSTAGSINKAYDLLLDHDLNIWGEVLLRVRLCLLAGPGTTLEDVRRARSHPQALAQCERYLVQHGIEPETTYNTAGGARELAASPEPGVAVIASSLAAQIYGLNILAANVEDSSHNYTRFFVLGTQTPPRAERNKTSLIFAVRNVPGTLHGCLGEFAERGINLTKLESRPRRNRPWHYVFYLDFEGYWQDPPCEKALVGLLRRAAFVKLLGSYPAATMDEEEGKSGAGLA